MIYKNFINVPSDDEEVKKNRIARLVYRNDEMQFLHEREVLTIQWLLESVAGMYELMITIITTIFGSYLGFVSKVRWIKKYYRFEQHSTGSGKINDIEK